MADMLSSALFADATRPIVSVRCRQWIVVPPRRLSDAASCSPLEGDRRLRSARTTTGPARARFFLDGVLVDRNSKKPHGIGTFVFPKPENPGQPETDRRRDHQQERRWDRGAELPDLAIDPANRRAAARNTDPSSGVIASNHQIDDRPARKRAGNQCERGPAGRSHAPVNSRQPLKAKRDRPRATIRGCGRSVGSSRLSRTAPFTCSSFFDHAFLRPRGKRLRVHFARLREHCIAPLLLASLPHGSRARRRAWRCGFHGTANERYRRRRFGL
jgi:hypothetical protein